MSEKKQNGGTTFDLDNLTEKTWIDIEEKDGTKWGLCFKELSLEEVRKIRNKCRTNKVVFEDHQPHNVTVPDDQLETEMLLIESVCDWRGVLDVNGVNIPYSADPKTNICKSCKFLSGITTGATKHAEAKKNIEDSEEKI